MEVDAPRLVYRLKKGKCGLDGRRCLLENGRRENHGGFYFSCPAAVESESLLHSGRIHSYISPNITTDESWPSNAHMTVGNETDPRRS